MRSTTLVLALAACGDGLPAPDASPPDTAGAWGLVSVHYTPPDPKQQRGGRPVAFLGPDGALITATHTRDDGSANAFVPAGSSVTVVGTFRDYYSYLGAQPGDDIRIGAPLAPLETVNQMTVTALSDPLASQYWLYDSCSSQAQFATDATQGRAQLLVTDCGDGTADLLLVADRQPPIPSGYQYAARVAVPLGGRLAFPGPYVPAGTTVNTAFPAAAVGFVHVAQRVYARDLLFDSEVVFGGSSLNLTDGRGSITTMTPAPAGTVLVTAVDDTGTFNRTGQKHAVVWGPASAQVDVDASTDAVDSLLHLPEVHGKTVTWQHARDGVRPDFVRMFVSGPVTWDVAGPYASNGDGVSTLELPHLPPDLAPIDLTGAFVPAIAAIAGESALDRLSLLTWFPNGFSPWPIHDPTGRVFYETNNFNLNE